MQHSTETRTPTSITFDNLPMDIQITLFGKVVLATMAAVGIISYFIGKRKTRSPIKTALIGALMSIAPPLGLAYLVVLGLKKPLDDESDSKNAV